VQKYQMHRARQQQVGAHAISLPQNADDDQNEQTQSDIVLKEKVKEERKER